MDEDPINKARRDVEVAKNKLLKVYFESIRQRYIGSNEAYRAQIISELEKLLEGQTIGESKQIILFDGSIAREIRKKAGLRQKDLGNKAGFTQGYLSHIENGRQPRQNDHHREKTRKYLRWLKEHGYNPYNI